MNVIYLADRQPSPAPGPGGIPAERSRQLQGQFYQEGRDLADLCAPVVEPYRSTSHGLEQHLKGAFIRWKMDRIKALLANDPHCDVAVGLSIAAMVEAFSTRIVELQEGFDPNDGGYAA